VGGLLGSAMGAGAMVMYLAAGALGLPVFAYGNAGFHVLLGPTGGYLLAFPPAAAIVGRVAVRGKLGRSILAALLGMAMIHLGGWAQLSILTRSPAHALVIGTFPFLLQDTVKAALAGLVIWRAHHSLRLGS
jgi:biotin transport system substrate-specific component